MAESGTSVSFSRRRFRAADIGLEGNFFRAVFVIAFLLLAGGPPRGDGTSDFIFYFWFARYERPTRTNLFLIILSMPSVYNQHESSATEQQFRFWCIE